MGVEQISIALGIFAGAVQLMGYWLYNKGVGKKINTGSWSIWALGGVIDLVSYAALTEDWVKDILPAACAAAAIGTFCYALARRQFSWPDKIDWGFVGADGMVTVIWIFTNVVIANLLYQISTILSFIPMYRGLLSGKEKEKPLPWFIWTLAYAILAASVYLRLNRWEELAYPISHVAVHFVTAFIAVRKQSI